MTKPTRLAATCALAGALMFAVTPAVQAQSLTFSQGDLFASSVRGASYLKYWESGNMYGMGMHYMFLTVGATGEWVPGTPFQAIWISESDLNYFLSTGKLTATSPTTGGTTDPGTPTVNTPTTRATATPEPISMLLLSTGLVGIGGVGAIRRRRRGTA